MFDKEKKKVLKYEKSPGLEEQILYKFKDKRSFRNLARRAREKSFPRNPRGHSHIDLKGAVWRKNFISPKYVIFLADSEYISIKWVILS